MNIIVLIFTLHLIDICSAGFGNIFGGENTIPDYATEGYGVDISFPIHHYIDGKKSPWWKQRYEKSMEGCYELYSQRECDATERARLDMSKRQPAQQPNYTEVGFKKAHLPEDAWNQLLSFYEKYKDQSQPEAWGRGNTYVNTWESPSHMISFENKKFAEGQHMKQVLWEACKPIVEEWTGKKLKHTSLYGIRVYHDKAILATHVDRLPLVSSLIVQVSQDVNEPWPIEVYDHSGRAHNVTMKPGEIVLYESHTVLHGRPFPMNGSHYANVFVHYEPLDHEQNIAKLANKGKVPQQPKELKKKRKLERKEDYHEDHKNHEIGGHERHNHDYESIRRHMTQIDKENDAATNPHQSPAFRLRQAAQTGDVDAMEDLLEHDLAAAKKLINSVDEHNWEAIHEAARGGHLEAVKYLVVMGADIGAKTIKGETPLKVALYYLDDDDPVVEYLEGIGAPE